MRLLIVEDSDALRDALRSGLEGLGYVVDVAARGDDGLQRAMAGGYDLAIVDVMLPGLDGFALVRQLRAGGHDVPVLMLTARDTVADRVRGLDLGADDYLVKPFAVEELLARVRSLVRRGKAAPTPLVKIEDVTIDSVSHVVLRAGRPIDLSPREYALLEYLALRAGTVVTRDELERHLFEQPPADGSNAVDVLVGRLRRKLCPRGTQELIYTRRGHGYLMAAPP
ncbi:MAG: response regulator transcription factor [Planctomycetes bacterium]|nr:response regulator transcription factor [Planctomycetota bacterium]